MSSVRQYFDSDFDHALRVQVSIAGSPRPCEAALLYDTNAGVCFIAAYFSDESLTPEGFEEFISFLKPGAIQVSLAGDVRLPSGKAFHGQLRIHNVDPFRIEYQLFGDPSWRELLRLGPTRRLFLYAETDLPSDLVARLQEFAAPRGYDLQIRDTVYAKERSMLEEPLAFISHDSRDKGSVARPIALHLQKMLCPVWYDEYSLKLGDNLRESIERGLKATKKCVLVLSPSFLNNRGWGKKEFESIFTREIIEDKRLVLPVWVGVTKQQVYEYSPSLLNVKGIDWDALGENEVCRQIYLAVTDAA